MSIEPMLGPIDLTGEWLTSKLGSYPFKGLPAKHRTKLIDLLDWVIAGGESGPAARPLHPDWIRTLRMQCASAGVPFLFKQWGGWRPISEGEGDWYDSLYESRRKAKDGHDQVAIDEIWGRRCTVDTAVIHIDGTVFSDPSAFGAWQQGSVPMLTFAVGKHRSGRE